MKLVSPLETSVCGCKPPCGLPPCTTCGEDHGGHDHGGGIHLCRDCDLEYMLDGMQCSGCKRMRYATDSIATPFAESLWGKRCACPDPRPPSIRTVKKTAKAMLDAAGARAE